MVQEGFVNPTHASAALTPHLFDETQEKFPPEATGRRSPLGLVDREVLSDPGIHDPFKGINGHTCHAPDIGSVLLMASLPT